MCSHPCTFLFFLHFSSLQSVKYSKKRPKVLYFKSIMRTLLPFLLRLPSAAENDFACIMQGRVGARTSEKVRREMLAVLCERQTGKKKHARWRAAGRGRGQNILTRVFATRSHEVM